MPDILEKLRDLHKQATTENSHFYVASALEGAIAEIESLRETLKLVVGSRSNKTPYFEQSLYQEAVKVWGIHLSLIRRLRSVLN